MGGHSCFCAICGGPFGDIAFSPPHPDAHPDSEDESDGSSINITVHSDAAWSGPEDEGEDDDDDDDDDESQNQDTGSSDIDNNSQGSDHDAIELSDDEPEEDEAAGISTQTDDEVLFESEDSQEDVDIGLDDITPSEGSLESEDEGMLLSNRFGFDDNHWDEEPGAAYDRKILKPRHAHWIKILYALGCNVEAPGPSKCYLSGRGIADFYMGTVWFTPGPIRLRDPNYPRTHGRRRPFPDVPTYLDWTFEDPRKWVFPVHMPCLKILCQILTGRPTPYENPKLDKDALFFAMNSMADYVGGALNITYSPDQKRIPQYWESLPGNEYIHANPLSTESPHHQRVLGLVSNAIKTSHDRKYVMTDLAPKVKSDRFSKLPYDLIYVITRLLPDRDLFSLCSASYIVHKHLAQNGGFWRHRLTKISMPWFEEALDVFSSSGNEDGLKGKSWRAVMCALQELLCSEKLGKQGPLMGVYNRRRIWGCCQEIARQYFKTAKEVRERGAEALVKELEDYCGKEKRGGVGEMG
ncbi:hypothetical protein QBC36DRAFT_327644 [Triangularia setosa]|uniref:F-box domain-containing protein n=1 Tax=Triangularia setosa TaxID=2587417 RepID=A0AAN6W8X0_9PEZI|nr:hypothetical protein QBC36DRAFT_327644 [Podospora setosa]